MPSAIHHGPLGALTLFEDAGALVAIEFGQGRPERGSPLLDAVRRQLDAYFAGRPTAFDVPLAPAGTPFQRRVWRAMAAIPYGEVRTYGGLAAPLGSAARAVGMACGANPIPIVVPCHRVVAAGGRLGGYSGGEGAATKTFLLRLEGAALA